MPPSSDAAPDSARPFSSYGEALATLLASLRDMAPLGRWMAARRDESGWTLLETAARESQPRGGEAAPELVCLRLAEDMRPRFIADAALMDDGPERRVLAQAGIAACILCPLISRRGELLGAIFATDARPQPDCTPQQRRLVTGVARTLATLLAHSLRHEEPREARLAGGEAFSTLPNLQTWMAMMEEEEGALVESDEEAMAVMIEVEEAAHADPAESEIAMAHHAALLKTCLRDQDRVARIGRNRFALLLRNLDGAQAHAMLDKVSAALRHAGAAAAFGCALRRSCGTLSEAFRIADIRMYNEKLRHG
jgi:GAF domain-containing protein